MAQSTAKAAALSMNSSEELLSGMGMIRRLLILGAVFVVVGYLLIGSALVIELTVFDPLADQYYGTEKAVRDAAPTDSVAC